MVLDTQYDVGVTIHCVVEDHQRDVETKITNLTAGTAKCQWGEWMSYGIVDGKVVYL
jgi:hypothetical protein